MSIEAMVRAGASCLLLIATGACFFMETGTSSGTSRPPTVARAEPAGPESRGPAPAEGGTGVSRVRTSVPRVTGPDPREFKLERGWLRRTPRGLGIVTRFTPGPFEQGVAWFELAIRHEPAGQHGLATLVATTVADAPRIDEGRPSLRSAIGALGGTLDVVVDGCVTRFRIGVPHFQVAPALGELASALRVRPSGPAIDSGQALALRTLSDLAAHDPLLGALRQVTATHQLEQHPLDVLQDATRARVALFHEQCYRPAGAVLTICSWRDAASQVAEVEKALEPWLAQFPEQAAVPTPPFARPPGILWAAGPAPSRMALLFDLPPPTDVAVVPLLVLLECLADTAPDARLMRAIERATGARPTVESVLLENGPAQTLALTLEIAPAKVEAIAAAAREAIADLAAKGPTDAEAARAAARLRLRLMRDQANPLGYCTVATRCVLANPEFDPVVLLAVAAALDTPESLEYGPVLPLFSARPVTVVVAGGEPPEEQERAIARLGALRTSEDLAVYGADAAAQRAAGTVYVERAIGALGGRELLKAFDGYHGLLVVRTGRSPACVELVGYAREGPRFRRLRSVLATTIDTLVDAGGGSDQVEDRTVELPADEVRRVLDRAARHPLALVAACARGEAAYRLIATRRVDDRTQAILELIDPSQSRLRLHVDAESGLVRAVDTVEHRPGIGTVTVTERFRDYRNVGGLRAPFVVTTLIDEGSIGSVATWEEFNPTAPPAEAMARPAK